MLIGVHHQHRLAVGGFDEILQRVQLFIVNHADVVELIVHRAVGQLQQLARQRGGVQRQHIAICVWKQHVPLHLPVQLFLPGRERQLHHVIDALRHLQMVCRLHGHAEVAQSSIDLLLRARLQLVLIGQPAVGRGKIQIEVAAHGASQSLPSIQQKHLRPQILQPVGSGRAGESYHAPELSQHLLQRQKAFRPAVFEGRKLVDHQHIEGQLSPGIVLHQPFHVFPVDDVQLRLS